MIDFVNISPMTIILHEPVGLLLASFEVISLGGFKTG